MLKTIVLTSNLASITTFDRSVVTNNESVALCDLSNRFVLCAVLVVINNRYTLVLNNDDCNNYVTLLALFGLEVIIYFVIW